MKFRAMGMSPADAMIQAGRRRLCPNDARPPVAAVAGMLPLALARGAGSQMLQPLAIAVIGGILISMVSLLGHHFSGALLLDRQGLESNPIPTCETDLQNSRPEPSQALTSNARGNARGIPRKPT